MQTGDGAIVRGGVRPVKRDVASAPGRMLY
jgi:hypothetical protein